MLKEYLKIGNTDCTTFCMNEPKVLIIQPIDKENGEMAEREANVLALRTAESFLFVAFEVDKWNSDLSVWEAPSPFGDEPFGAGAQDTLKVIEEEILPVIFGRFGLPESIPVILGGYSLAGLFSLWCGYRTGRFTAIAAVSPSVWFDGWLEYAGDKKPLTKCIYLSLGDKEDRAKNKVMATVKECIIRQYDLLTRNLILRTLEWNEGNHFKDAEIRCVKGFEWCIRTISQQLIS